MEREDIINLSREINYEDLEKAINILEKNYEISYGRYESHELKKALDGKKPIVIKNHFLIGYEGDKFIDINEKKIPVERMVKAIIVEDIKDIPSIVEKERDPFAIIGRNEWDEMSSDFQNLIGQLKVGEVFLPPHSVIFNFLKPTEKQKKEKIVSMLAGININIYDSNNYIDNSLHEIGHLFWRDCLVEEEKRAFLDFFHVLKPSAIYEFEWEFSSEEEVFCTIYKWYLKSILLNRAFYNILQFEEPRGLKLFQDILTRISRDRQIADIWNMNKQEFLDYLQPKFDVTTGKKLRKAGMFDKIKDIEIPSSELLDIERIENGIEYVRLDKAITVPVKDNKVFWNEIDG